MVVLSSSPGVTVPRESGHLNTIIHHFGLAMLIVNNALEPATPAPTPTFVSEWTRWSRCSVTCGQGRRSRRRDCIPGDDGLSCPPRLEEQDRCYERECTVRPGIKRPLYCLIVSDASCFLVILFCCWHSAKTLVSFELFKFFASSYVMKNCNKIFHHLC